jgi:hypothetical protein
MADLIAQLQALQEQHGGFYMLQGMQFPDPPEKNEYGQPVFKKSQIVDPLFYSVYAHDIHAALNERGTPRIDMEG